MEDLVETLAIGLILSLILIFISWWFWKRYDEPSEAQIEREESIAKKKEETQMWRAVEAQMACLLYTSPSPRDRTRSRMPSSA